MISADARSPPTRIIRRFTRRTGYPMCVPRTNPATQDDPECPKGNRPLDPVTGAPLKKFHDGGSWNPGRADEPIEASALDGW